HPSSCSPSPPYSQICTLSLHDALPISILHSPGQDVGAQWIRRRAAAEELTESGAEAHERIGAELRGTAHGRSGQELGERIHRRVDRKSTRLNSSHVSISYAVFCLKKKK